VWTDPKDPDLKGVLIWRDGDKKVEIKAGVMKWVDTEGLANGTQYKYLIQTFDSNGNYSKGIFVTGIPEASGTTQFKYPTLDGDTYIYEYSPGTNYGQKSLYTGYFSKSDVWILLNFDMAELIKTTPKIISAKLRMYYTGYKVERGFKEVNTDTFVLRIFDQGLRPWTEDNATWENMVKYVDLDRAYSDVVTIVYGQNTWYEWDVTELVYLWVSDPKGYPENGLAIMAKVDGSQVYNFHSEESDVSSDVSFKPELIVEIPN